VHETNDSCTIKFKQPGLRKIAYQAGQFITLIVQINGRVYQRPYSISSVFGIDPTLNITVKAIENGVVSNYLKHTLCEGQAIEIVEPLGTFTIPDGFTYDLILWAAGSGISPIFALLKKSLMHSPNKVVLNYSSKNSEQTILLNEILNLQQIYSDRFEFHLFLSEAHEKEKLNYYPRMDAQHVELIGSKRNNSALHFICGPDTYSKFVKTLLLERGIPENNIRTEDFSLSLRALLMWMWIF
jgi:ring-1,2-phenylacetyl-CoA epoxidase subunit PaaE